MRSAFILKKLANAFQKPLSFPRLALPYNQYFPTFLPEQPAILAVPFSITFEL